MAHQLDTDILSFLLKGSANIMQRFTPYLVEEGTIHLSVITVYEVKKGLYHVNSQRKLNAFNRFLDDCTVHQVTREIADFAAAVKGKLMQEGKGIDHPDMLIGATALHNGHILVTNNTQHFEVIPGLQLENWTK